MPIDDESLADDVERMEQRRRDSLAFIRQRDAARVAGGEPIAGSAAADRHALLAEVARLAEEVERLRGCARAYDINDVGLYAFWERWRAVWPDGSERIFDTLDAAWTALDAARRGEAGQGGGE